VISVKKQVYIFDFDGTLADSKDRSVVSTQKAFEELNLDAPTSEEVEHYMGIPIESSFRSMAKAEFQEEEFIALLTCFRRIYKEQETGLLKTFPYVPEVLKTLKEDDRSIFVISSKHSDVLKRNLKSLKIHEFFNDVLGSDTVSHYKPHPDGIYKVLEKYNFKKKEVVMIGDSTYDIQMAKNAQVSSCGVTWGAHSEEQLRLETPDHLVHNFQDILSI
jgi:phosphoglycolate phosphatase